jgi:hypothetical protein
MPRGRPQGLRSAELARPAGTPAGLREPHQPLRWARIRPARSRFMGRVGSCRRGGQAVGHPAHVSRGREAAPLRAEQRLGRWNRRPGVRMAGHGRPTSRMLVGTWSRLFRGKAQTWPRSAQEPAAVAERAEQVLEVLGRVVPYEAASIPVRIRSGRPVRPRRFGETAALRAYSESRRATPSWT